MRFLRTLLLIVLTGGTAARLLAQNGPDPGQPRPPLLLEGSRAERLDAAVQVYLAEFVAAVQRADTAALVSLIPSAVVPEAEKNAASRAGCSSLGDALVRLREARARESLSPEMPLISVRIGNVDVLTATAGDTVARVRSRLLERREGQIRYAPIEWVFTEADGAWRMAVASGALAGLCGLAVAGSRL